MKSSSIFNNKQKVKKEPPKVKQPEVKVKRKETVVINKPTKSERVKEVPRINRVQSTIEPKKPVDKFSTLEPVDKFSKPEPVKSIDKVSIDEVGETVVKINKDLPVHECHLIDFSKNQHTDKALIKLNAFYPDSRIGIIDDLTLNVSYAAYLDGATYIFTESAMIQPVVKAVLSRGIVVEVKNKKGALTTFLITKEGFTSIPALKEESLKGEIEIQGKLFSSHSTQNKLPEITEDITSYYYDDVRYDLYSDGRLIEYNLEEKRRLLLADTNGCYVELYIILNDEEYHTIKDKEYKVLGRIAKTFCLIEERKTGVHYALSVRGANLIELGRISNSLPSLTKSKYNGISNGVPMLTKHNKLANDLTLTIFTPQIKRLIISKDSFVDTNYISNGVYLPDEQIIVMHDGAIIFAEESRQTLTINNTGEVICRNYGYLGDLDD